MTPSAAVAIVSVAAVATAAAVSAAKSKGPRSPEGSRDAAADYGRGGPPISLCVPFRRVYPPLFHDFSCPLLNPGVYTTRRTCSSSNS